jgi:hypothetical protein
MVTVSNSLATEIITKANTKWVASMAKDVTYGKMVHHMMVIS